MEGGCSLSIPRIRGSSEGLCRSGTHLRFSSDSRLTQDLPFVLASPPSTFTGPSLPHLPLGLLPEITCFYTDPQLSSAPLAERHCPSHGGITALGPYGIFELPPLVLRGSGCVSGTRQAHSGHASACPGTHCSVPVQTPSCSARSLPQH